jgi:non-specific serine/threonine protein kinase
MVGREREAAEILELLESARLLTVTGAAGTGKTRLAVDVAGRAADRHPDGAVFVPLADVVGGDDPAGALARALVRALGLNDSVGESTFAAVTLQLAGRRQLLVLDNFEHLAEAAPSVAELLAGCPGVTALVTSRFVLRLPGEQEYPLPPLAPPAADAPPAELRRSPAVELFLARARAVLPSFAPDDRDLAYVGEICRRLDGLPLALELAAALIKMFSPETLWERLAGRLDLLSSRARRRGGSQRTLEQALAWSHELLDDDERSLLRGLTVFSGGFRLEAVEAVYGAGPEETVDRVSALVDKSLVERRAASDGGARFLLLETTREFALRRLRETGEETALRKAHADWALGVARRGAAALEGGDQKACLDRLDAEYPNLLAAIRWSRDGLGEDGGDDGELALAIETAAALGRYWSVRAAYREGRSILSELLDPEHPRAGSVPPAVRAEGLVALGLLSLLLCAYREAKEELDEARELLEETGDRRRLATLLNHRAWGALQVDPMDRAEELALEGLRANEEEGDLRGRAVALHNLGHIEIYRGDAAAAEERFLASLEQRRRIGDDRGVAFTLANLASVRLLLGIEPDRIEPDRIEPVGGWLDEAEELVSRLDDRPLLGWVTCQRLRLDRLRGRLDDALRRLDTPALDSTVGVHPEATAWLRYLTGDLRMARDEPDEARAALDEARRIWKEIGCHWGEASASLRLADLAHGSDRDEAGRLRGRALELAERFGLDALAQEARGALGAD